MRPRNEIPVFFTIDDAYAPYLAVALRSAIDNASPTRTYRAVILHQGLSEENVRRLGAMATEFFAVDFIPMGDGLSAITDRMSNRLRCDYFTLTIYFRLFIPAMFPEYDKAIYVDSDVAVTGDLAELFDTDLCGKYVGACNDLSVQDVPPLCRYMEEAVGVSRHEYINSGVLLMDLRALREVQLDQRFLELLTTYHFDCIAPDQDYLNAMLNGKIHYLGEEWDAMPAEGRPPLATPKLIHYNLFSKPWCYDNVPYGDVFWHYAEKTEYIDEIRAYKDAYSEAMKAKDRECAALLARRGAEIAEGELTFRSAAEKGVSIRL